MTNFTSKSKVGEIVAEDYRTAGVFKRYGLDFCCGGGKSLEAACRKKGINPDDLLADLKTLADEPEAAHNYSDWSLDVLIDFIINTHHNFVRSKLREIKGYAKKVARVHGKTYPRLNRMRDLFMELDRELISHLEKEEKILFPYIKEMVIKAGKGEKITEKPSFGTAENPVKMMEAEHEKAGSIVTELENISSYFTPPEDACTTFKVYFKNLKAFQKDLHKHVHLENNILFPKALILEKQIQDFPE